MTDKAISRWERGVGFPDINMIEPLASALEISVWELMKSERMESRDFSNAEDTELMKSAVEIEKENRKQEQTAIGLGIFTAIIVTVLSKIAALGSLGGSLVLGVFVAIAQVFLYYYLEDRECAKSRRVYGILFLLVIALISVLMLVALNA